MNISVSVGEAIDKYSILQLKLAKITDPTKLVEIQKEIAALQICTEYIIGYDFFYKLLVHINDQIWILTDIIKVMLPNNPAFPWTSDEIFKLNQKRYRLKNAFNILSGSEIKEQKSYSQSSCHILTDTETVYRKIPEINYLLLEYDSVSFDVEMQDYWVTLL